MLNQMRKIRHFAAVLSCVIILGIFFSTVPTFALEIKTTPQQERERHALLIHNKVQSIDTNASRNISAYKSLQDFDGNPYLLIECAPVGYLIYHPASARFVEYAADSPSPYSGRGGELLYGGPTQYFYEKADGTYQNTLEKARILESDEIQALAPQSENIQKEMIKQSDTAALAYTQKRFAPRALASSSTTTYYIPQSKFLSGLDKCGYYRPDGSKGVCGYIAAAMTLYYYKISGRRNVMDDDYYYPHNGKKLSDSLTKYLLRIGKDLGYDDTTTSVAIHYTMKEYLKREGIRGNIDHTSRYVPFFTSTTIALLLENKQPVIIFGNLYSPRSGKFVNHAVLAYGYKATLNGSDMTFEFIAHFGYDDFRQVTIMGVYGSIYSLKC